jgi:hypothetical protein
VNTAALPGPLRHFLAQLDELRSGDAPDMGKVGAALVELAADQEFFGPLIAQMPAGSPEVNWLIQPERGPRLVLVHRPEGVMAYTTPTAAGSRSPRSGGWRPISAGTWSATPAAAPS